MQNFDELRIKLPCQEISITGPLLFLSPFSTALFSSDFWLPLSALLYPCRVNLQKNRAEQKHYHQRYYSSQHDSNKPLKHTMVLHACKTFSLNISLLWYCDSFFYKPHLRWFNLNTCSYQPVLRNIESNLIKMKQDGSVIVRWRKGQFAQKLLYQRVLWKWNIHVYRFFKVTFI